jgi:PAS domain S-box-containing protein
VTAIDTAPITALVAATGQTCARIEALLQAAPRSRYRVVSADQDNVVVQLCSQPPDVCLLEASLDGADGVRLIREAIARGCFAPIVVLFGDHAPESDADVIRAGASDALVLSTLTAESLDRTIRYAIERALSFVLLQESERRKSAETAASEHRAREFVEQAIHGIYRASPDGRFLEVNPALVELLGYGSAAEVLALDIGRDVYADRDERRKFVDALRTSGAAAERVVKWKRAGGDLITVRIRARPIFGADRTLEAIESTAEDVTHRTLLEQQLLQAQKMETIGQLAGGIAHDFNNLLTAILGYSDLLLEDIQPGDRRRDDLGEIRRAAERAAALTRQLLAFSRQQILRPVVMDLNATITGLSRMIRRLIGEHIHVALHLAPDLRPILADPGQIEQVIVNLAVNARDAMPGGGALTLETDAVQVDETQARQSGLKPGRYVRLRVVDTGQGMPPEVISHIFEPFFTTKEPGKGTGLGLATVYGIIKQSTGEIAVSSTPGEGTTFTLHFPQATGSMGTAPAAAAHKTGGSETVLLVEDEPSVRALAAEVLERNGYRVVAAENGDRALELADARDGPIHLLLTDVVMPRMSGRELAEKLLASRPDTKVLFMSGYTDDAIVQHGVLEAGTEFLQKPFTRDALTVRVREVLDS